MNIINLSAKSCMTHLLLKETFDSFSFIEGEITTFNKFTMDGYLQKSFFDEAPTQEYSTWKDLRPFCLSLIRGKRTPLSFHFILSLPPEKYESFIEEHQLASTYRPEEIQGMYLNFRYDGSVLQCVTGISLRSFRMEKSLEREWDDQAMLFFKKLGIVE